MTSLQLALGSLSLCLLQGCASPPQRVVVTASNVQSECPPLFGKVCYGSVPGAMKCGCSTVSPLGTPYQ
jgi:hypothetical protein